MKICARFIWRKPVTPSCHILDLSDEDWSRFLKASNDKRADIVCELLGRESLRQYVKELTWIPLYGQHLLVETGKE